jgi:glucose-6-phosphate-specific signal transduction histidine kinase
MEYIDELRKTMAEHKLIFMYEGEFTQDIILSLLRVAEKKMNALGENLKVTRKVFNVMTECLQNIVKYSDQVPNENAQVVGAPEDEAKTVESNDATSVSPDAQPANAAGTTTV